MKGFFITGTDTNVGKTYVSCLIAQHLTNSGASVIPRKPVETGCKIDKGELLPADAIALQQAANFKGNINEVCPFRFKPAISPQRAARLAHQTLNITEVYTACTKNISASDFLLIEGAGGFYSPLCEDGLNADLAEKINLPIVLVAADKLGCISHILLAIEAIKSRGLILSAVILNEVDNNAGEPLVNNFEDLSSLIKHPIIQIPHSTKPQLQDSLTVQKWLDSICHNL